MLYNPSNISPATASAITGRSLATCRGKAPKQHLRALAVDLALGRVHLVHPTVAQAAELTGISPNYLGAALPSRGGRNPRRQTRVETLALLWEAATGVERREFIRRAGPDMVFDTAIEAVD